MRLERAAGAVVLVGGPVPPGAAAITLGRLIVVTEAARRSPGWPALLRHELIHVRQWREQGVLGFLVAYLGSYLRLRLAGWPHWGAYRRIPHEVEAAWLSRQAVDADAERP